MNLRRGLFRLWVVLSAFWIFGIGSFIASNTNWSPNSFVPPAKPVQETKSLTPALDALAAQEEAQSASVGTPGENGIPLFPSSGGLTTSNGQGMSETSRIPWGIDLALVLGPPSFFFLLGVAFLWIIAGFRTSKTQKTA
jgi:hypothetical protein